MSGAPWPGRATRFGLRKSKRQVSRALRFIARDAAANVAFYSTRKRRRRMRSDV